MTSTIVLIASGVLIGAGISVIWRDVHRSRRKAFVLQRDLPTTEEVGDPEIEITISRVDAEAVPSTYRGLSSLASLTSRPKQRAPEPVVAGPLAQLREAVAAHERNPEPWTELERRPTLEQRWAGLQPSLLAGVEQVNEVLAPARLSLGNPGQASWSYKNKGYGVHRRLLLGEDSLAWMRMELTEAGLFDVTIKSHKPDWAAANNAVTTQAEGLTSAAISDLLSACLKPAAAHAAKLAHNGGAPTTIVDGAWQDVDAIVAAALRATNGALAQAGAKLMPLAPAAWDAELRRHRMTLAVEVDTSDVARMQIERLPHEMEVAVGVKDVQMIDLGRRRRIPIEGMTTHALAELIASCAWPAIARFKDVRRTA